MTRSTRPGSVRLVLLASTLAAASFVTSGAAKAAPRVGTCTDNVIPVSLRAGRPLNQQIYGRLCLPAAGLPATVQLLVPGFSYGNTYWDFPDPTSGTRRYSYVAAALASGYATFAIDRIGTGRSSHPPSAEATSSADAYTIHQVVLALRTGGVSGSRGQVSFEKVVGVGHSLGTILLWAEASRYQDIDGLVASGATHHYDAVGNSAVTSSDYPAILDPQFADGDYDAAYLTTRPGTRYKAFYAPAVVDHAVVDYDEAHKYPSSGGEFEAGLMLQEALDIRAPVLVAVGSLDPSFCSGSSSPDCASGDALAQAEAPYLGPAVPSVSGFVLPEAGHDLNMMLNAELWFTAAQSWVDAYVGGARRRPVSARPS
jgi:pimeloyl-ACP methyl ester carboxylesterase